MNLALSIKCLHNNSAFLASRWNHSTIVKNNLAYWIWCYSCSLLIIICLATCTCVHAEGTTCLSNRVLQQIGKFVCPKMVQSAMYKDVMLMSIASIHILKVYNKYILRMEYHNDTSQFNFIISSIANSCGHPLTCKEVFHYQGADDQCAYGLKAQLFQFDSNLPLRYSLLVVKLPPPLPRSRRWQHYFC